MGRNTMLRTANTSLIEDIVDLLYAWGQACFNEITPNVNGKFFRLDSSPEENQDVNFMFKVLAPTQVASYDMDSAGLANSWMLNKKFSIAIEITSRFLYAQDDEQNQRPYDGVFLYEERFTTYVEDQKRQMIDLLKTNPPLYSVFRIASSLRLVEVNQVEMNADEDRKKIIIFYETLNFNVYNPVYLPNSITMQQFILEFIINQSTGVRNNKIKEKND